MLTPVILELHLKKRKFIQYEKETPNAATSEVAYLHKPNDDYNETNSGKNYFFSLDTTWTA
jgi:hypothetical protein